MTDEPVVRVVRGEPTPAELAALVTVVLAGGARRPAGRRRSRWADPAYAVRGRLAADATHRPLARRGWTGQPT